jgi:hypothetical protein
MLGPEAWSWRAKGSFQTSTSEKQSGLSCEKLLRALRVFFWTLFSTEFDEFPEFPRFGGIGGRVLGIQFDASQHVVVVAPAR